MCEKDPYQLFKQNSYFFQPQRKQNHMSWYSLEVPQQGISNMSTNKMCFNAENIFFLSGYPSYLEIGLMQWSWVSVCWYIILVLGTGEENHIRLSEK